MNWNKLKFFLIDLAVRYWYLILALAVFVVVAGTIDSCRRRSVEKKIDKYDRIATEQETIANVRTEERRELENELKNAESDTENARDNRNAVAGRDSRSFPTADNERKFCEQFPLDSTCREYCAKHGCP